jgi:hypothetical protein
LPGKSDHAASDAGGLVPLASDFATVIEAGWNDQGAQGRRFSPTNSFRFQRPRELSDGMVPNRAGVRAIAKAWLMAN